MTSIPILHTDRCTLSAITQSDIPVLRQILDDAETQRFLPELCDEFQTAESLQQFVASFDHLLLQDEGILWGIRKDNVFIGFIAIMDIMTNPTLFYAMSPNHRYKGIMTECVAVVVKWFCANCPTLHLHTEVYKGNTTSIHLLQKNNFTQLDEDEYKIFLKVEAIVE